MIEWSALAGITALIIYAIVIFNRLVRDRQRTRAGWSDIEVQLKRRHDLIPQLVAAVKQYAAYEQATLDQVTALRSRAGDMQAAARQGWLETDISLSLVSIFALQEAYSELKANQSFLQLQIDISNVEADIQFARRYYNGAVRNLNIRIETFPDLVVGFEVLAVTRDGHTEPFNIKNHANGKRVYIGEQNVFPVARLLRV
jgi:LemA protein